MSVEEDDGLLRVEEELECPICMKLLYRPVSTMCGHTFCKLCLEQTLQHQSACPICRQTISNRDNQVHDSRLVQRLIERHYPQQIANRKIEVSIALQQADIYFRKRRHDQLRTFLKCEEGEDEKRLPILLQRQRFDLPFPGETCELYFEGPQFLAFVSEIISEGIPGFVLSCEKSKGDHTAADELWRVGLLMKILQHHSLSLPEETETPPVREEGLSTWGALVHSLRNTSRASMPPTMFAWVPARYTRQRRRFLGNKRELSATNPSQQITPLGSCCVVRCEVMSRVEFKMESSNEAIGIGCVKPLFDEVLTFDENATARSHSRTEQLAHQIQHDIQETLHGMGPTARLIFMRRFGSVPIVPIRPTSCQLETVSFDLCKPLVLTPDKRLELLTIADTYKRFSVIKDLLAAAAPGNVLSLSLNAESGLSDPLSFLLFKGAWSSMGLGMVLAAILLLSAILNYLGSSPSRTYYRQGQVYAARIFNFAAQNAEEVSSQLHF